MSENCGKCSKWRLQTASSVYLTVQNPKKTLHVLLEITKRSSESSCLTCWCLTSSPEKCLPWINNHQTINWLIVGFTNLKSLVACFLPFFFLFYSLALKWSNFKKTAESPWQPAFVNPVSQFVRRRIVKVSAVSRLEA